MGMFQGLDTSASGLTAERLRLDLIANNIANVNTTRTGRTTALGNQIPYTRQMAVFVPRPPEANFAQILGQAVAVANTQNGMTPGGSVTPGGLAASGSSLAAGVPAFSNGVQVAAIVEDRAPYELEYNPDSPDAVRVPENGVPVGYVRKPNVNIVTEMVDMISASRAYEANVTALNASKAMFSKALEIGKG